MPKCKVTMNRDNCASCGNCWTTCPDFFEQSTEDGLSQVTGKYRSGDFLTEGDAPENLEESVRQAAESCPADVIHVQ